MTSTIGYPRPQLQRAGWMSLNGTWEFGLDPEARWELPAEVVWESTIIVPYAPETPASGIGNTGFYRVCWYRRTFELEPIPAGKRVLLHFGAVDYSATVWVNGAIVARHEGGYTPFSADITNAVSGPGPHTVVVRAEDDPWDLAKPRGKQDWQLRPHSIWYPRTTGIWQTVWLEVVSSTFIGCLRLVASLERWAIEVFARVEGELRNGLQLRVRLIAAEKLLSEDAYTVVSGEVHRQIMLSDPGIDDFRNELLWTPYVPNLIDVDLQLVDEWGNLLDQVRSYTALRSITIQGDRFVLNGRPLRLRMVLDQGYWPETGMTAPNDRALRRDVELVKAMGFNGVRKHQKIEDPRYLYWADHLGLLVWEEMPSAYRYTKESIERVIREWISVVERDLSHPCIAAWVPFNESWGVPDLPGSASQRHYVQSLYHLTRTLDTTRPVIGNDGWESVATDIIGIHDYDDSPERIARRYGSDEEAVVARFFKRERPGGRLLLLNEHGHTGQPLMLTEFGGIAFSSRADDTWGYARAYSLEEFSRCYQQLMQVVNSLRLFAGFCYTQFADTYQEANGLLYADRKPKVPIEQIASATASSERIELDPEWRSMIMEQQKEELALPAAEPKSPGTR